MNQHEMFNQLLDSTKTFLDSPKAGDFNALDDFDNKLKGFVEMPTTLRFVHSEDDQVQPSSQFNLIKALRNLFQDIDFHHGHGLCALRLKNDHLVETASRCPSGTRIFYNQSYYDQNIQEGETSIIAE